MEARRLEERQCGLSAESRTSPATGIELHANGTQNSVPTEGSPVTAGAKSPTNIVAAAPDASGSASGAHVTASITAERHQTLHLELYGHTDAAVARTADQEQPEANDESVSRCRSRRTENGEQREFVGCNKRAGRDADSADAALTEAAAADPLSAEERPGPRTATPHRAVPHARAARAEAEGGPPAVPAAEAATSEVTPPWALVTGAAEGAHAPAAAADGVREITSEPHGKASGLQIVEADISAAKGSGSGLSLVSQTAAAVLAAAAEAASAAAIVEASQTPRAQSEGAPAEGGAACNDGRNHSPIRTLPEAVAPPRPLRVAVAAVPMPTETPSYELPEGIGLAPEEEEGDLPAFADEENIALHCQIREKQRRLSEQGTKLGQKVERVLLMRQHLQQLRAESAHLESLAAAKEAQLNSDKHMEGVALRQASKLRCEMQQQQRQQQQLQARLTALQLDIARGQEQLDCFKLRMKWNEEELAQWRSAAHQKEVRQIRAPQQSALLQTPHNMKHRKRQGQALKGRFPAQTARRFLEELLPSCFVLAPY